MDTPQFIIAEAMPEADEAMAAYAQALGQVLTDNAGRLLLIAGSGASEVLEEGSVQHAVVVLKFPGAAAAGAFWSDARHQSALAALTDESGFLHAISIAGIPEEGLPDEALPTTANVTIPNSPGPRAYMLVQGTISDPEPIGKYMETIVPLIIERGGVYRVWTDPDGPDVLAGQWAAQYVVLSEWPSVGAARDMWYSDTYQKVAIPTRKPASDFTVLLFEASVASP